MDPTLFTSLGGGALLGAAGLWYWQRTKLGPLQLHAATILQEAQAQAREVTHQAELAAKQKQFDLQRSFESGLQEEKQRLKREEERIQQREDKVEQRMSLIEKKLSDTEKREAVLIARRERLEEEKQSIKQLKAELLAQAEKNSNWTTSEAREFLLEKAQEDMRAETAQLIRKAKKEAEEQSSQEAGKIIAAAIQRMAVPSVHEVTINTVTLPNDEMKGRIIGREGRNIRTLERLTGVNFIIDDTPGAIVISGFDPIRLAIAKTTLTELIKDGRIHPTSIEETVEAATLNIQKQIKQYGEDAALRVGAINLHPELIQLLGKLKFRYSLGQNILDHSLEVAHLMGMMAAELGLDERLAKRIGLLHDVGKALTHELEGTHAMIGHNMALKYGETREVANGIGCHHNEMAPITVEGSLCNPADAISASRQGARSESVDEYIKRLKVLEEMAYSYPGVDRAYALQAGREVRVVVMPDQFDDDGVIHLARDLTRRIEKELNYPGKIKVTVIREKRVVEYAI